MHKFVKIDVSEFFSIHLTGVAHQAADQTAWLLHTSVLGGLVTVQGHSYVGLNLGKGKVLQILSNLWPKLERNEPYVCRKKDALRQYFTRIIKKNQQLATILKILPPTNSGVAHLSCIMLLWNTCSLLQVHTAQHWCGNVSLPPCGESDVHLGFTLSVKIMLICCNLPTDAQTGSTRPETREREKENKGFTWCTLHNCLHRRPLSQPLYKAFKWVLVFWYRTIFSCFMWCQICCSPAPVQLDCFYDCSILSFHAHYCCLRVLKLSHVSHYPAQLC